MSALCCVNKYSNCNVLMLATAMCNDDGRAIFYAQTLESQLAQERIEVDHLRTLVQRAKEKIDEDKEALKKATR